VPARWRSAIFRKSSSFALCAAIGLGVAPSAAAPSLQPSLEQIVRQFDDVAFGHEHGPSLGVVQKWTENPGLALFTDGHWDLAPYIPAIESYLGAIGRLTGLPVVAERADARKATLRLGFYPRMEFARMPRTGSEAEFRRWVTTSACIAMAVEDPERTGHIVAAAIAIGTDISESQRRHCLLEELVQAMGLPNDACHYRPSLFCEADRVFELTPADRILLRTLYDPRLTVGMAREQALPIVRTVVAELIPSLAAP
jgi:hypothetical protein